MLLALITPLTLAKTEDASIIQQMEQIKPILVQMDNLLIHLQTHANAQIHSHSLMAPLAFPAICQISGTLQALHANLALLALFTTFLHRIVQFAHN